MDGGDGTSSLAARIAELARAPILLVAADFDGTLAARVANPETAVADRAAISALRTIAELQQTHAVILTVGALADLSRGASPGPIVHHVGSHGAEVAPGDTIPLTDEQRREHERAHEAASRVGETPAPSVPPDEDKGKALARIRRRVGASHVLFLGDDATDEAAFAILEERDVGVRVGAGETLARHRIAEAPAIAPLLEEVARLRRAFLVANAAVPLEHHALLSDHRSIALVTPVGRVTWACLPRIDSPALFAELVGGEAHGFFEVRPADGSPPVSQRYVDDTMILETKWPTLRVVDYLDASGGRAFQRAGRTDLVRVVEGSGRVRITFAPRVDFGRSTTRLRVVDGGLFVDGVRDSCVLRAPGVEFRVEDAGPHDTAVAEVELRDRLVLELRYGTSNLAAAVESEAQRRSRTAMLWSAWAKRLSLPKTARDLVLRSALTLRALTYGPNGAIAAAATTSLPEQIGGMRNWDYRLCWPRDAAIAANALALLGATGPGIKLLDWMLGILDRADPGSVVAPVYTVAGGHVAAEGDLSELAGYRGSRPVRVGNAAAQQVQLDVYGPIVELLATLARQNAPLSYEHWRMVEAIVETVAAHWQQPDHGIWEIRGPQQHHVHTKAMCWLAVDRACAVATYMGREIGKWRELRREIADELLAQGPRSSDQSFGSAYGGANSDAAALWVGLSGLLPPDDRRFLATVTRVERDLLHAPTVYRYRHDDGLPGVEGGFHLCTTWLIRAWLRVGRDADARRLFEQYVALGGPLGLFAEEHDPTHAIALGNYPQGYSHAGLIEAALALDGVPIASVASPETPRA